MNEINFTQSFFKQSKNPTNEIYFFNIFFFVLHGKYIFAMVIKYDD